MLGAFVIDMPVCLIDELVVVVEVRVVRIVAGTDDVTVKSIGDINRGMIWLISSF